ncbi:MAG: VCBS repeat-containing protein, partial [Thermoplasmata archaeon]
GRIEFSVGLDKLPGIDPNSKFYFEMSNWLGQKDASEIAYRALSEHTRWWHERVMRMFAQAVDVYGGGDTDDIRCIAAGDIDLDGDIDFVTGDSGDDVDWWPNPGTNPFGTWIKSSVAQNLAGAPFIRSVALADLDNDGDLDVVASSNDNNDNNGETWVIENRWSGSGVTWGTPSGIGTNDYDRVGDMDVGDFDNDGWIDIAVCYRTNNGQRLVLYRNDHTPFDSTWSTYRDITGDTDFDFLALAIADLDRDGDLDIAVGRDSSVQNNNLFIYGNPGPNLAFSPFVAWSVRNLGGGSGNTGSYIVDLAVADFDNNGTIDIVSMEGNNAVTAYIDVWKNPGVNVFTSGAWSKNPVGSVTAAANADASAGIRDLTVADFDNDGWIDIGCGSEEGNSNGRMRVWENNHSPFSGTWPLLDLGGLGGSSDIFGVSSADVDRDGDFELVGSDVNNNLWLYNNTLVHRSMEFVFGATMSGALSEDALCMAAADLDNDGDMDVVTGHRDGRIYAWNNTENTSVPAWSTWPSTLVDDLTDPVISIALGDLDRNGKIDLAVAEELGNDDAFIYIYNNTNPFTPGGWTDRIRIDQWSDGTNSPLGLADFDKDGDLDIVSGDSYGNVGLFRNDGTPFDGGWSGWDNIFSGGSKMNAIAVADLDSDGDPDVISADEGGALRIHQCPITPFGSGDWAYNQIGSLGVSINAVVVGNPDRDKAVDILTADSGSSTQIKLFINPNSSNLNPFTNPWNSRNIANASGPVYALAGGDLDNDGDLDVVFGDVNGNLYTSKNPAVGGGGIVRTLIAELKYNITGVIAVNLDPKSNDPAISPDIGDLDIVVANDGDNNAGNITTWRNIGAMCTISATDSAPPEMKPGMSDDILTVTVTHNGIGNDKSIEVSTWKFLFYCEYGPISASDLNALFSAYCIYLETGFTPGWDPGDTYIPQVTGSPKVEDGAVWITLPDNNPDATVSAKNTKTYYLVVNITPTSPPPGITYFGVEFDPDGYGTGNWNYMNQSAESSFTDAVATIVEATTTVTKRVSVAEFPVFNSFFVWLLVLLQMIARLRKKRKRVTLIYQ